MIKVGLTGNMGSGKSTVAGIFEVLGVPVYHADSKARDMLGHREVVHAIGKRFGGRIVQGGEVDRHALAAIVFNDKTALDDLNAIIHPRVRRDLEEWISGQKDHPYIVQEAAILFESGFYTYFNRTVVVTCPEEMAIARVMKRDGLTHSEISARIRNQWSQQRKIEMADHVIQNDGTRLLIPQVMHIHRILTVNT